MKFEGAKGGPAGDRRVRRSRSALMRAAVALVTERGTAAVPLSDIAEAADVSRQVVYQQFGDRDALLLEAALDLARRELLPGVTDTADLTGRTQALALARHFTNHRVFYRAMLTGACSYPLNKALAEMVIPVNRQAVQLVYGQQLSLRTREDLAVFLTGGAAAFVNTWIVEGEEPLDPEEFTDRLLCAASVVITAIGQPAALTCDKEPGR